MSDEIGEQLAGWGLVIRLDTRGRVSGRTLTVALGYLEEPGGTVLVAAGDPDADWARNLEADPRCVVTIGDRRLEMHATPISGADAAAVVTGLILRYGTPAERLGRGPAFRLEPT